MAPPTGDGFEGREAELEEDEEETGSSEAAEVVCETPEEKSRPRVKTTRGDGGVAVSPAGSPAGCANAKAKRHEWSWTRHLTTKVTQLKPRLPGGAQESV